MVLLNASKNGIIEIVEFLLEQKGIDINFKDDVSLYNFGFQINIWKLFKIFNTALMLASENGHIEIVKLLLEQEGIDINAKDDLGKTALMRASIYGQTEIVKLLLEQEGIDVNTKDHWNGNSALMFASSNHLEIIKILLEHKRNDVNAKNHKN